MSLLDIVSNPQVGLLVFQYLDMTNVETCRLVSKKLQKFVDYTILKDPSIRKRLDLEYNAERWLAKKPLKEVRLSYDYLHIRPNRSKVKHAFFIDRHVVLVVKMGPIKRYVVMVYNEQGDRLQMHEMESPMFCGQTSWSLILIMNDSDVILDIASRECRPKMVHGLDKSTLVRFETANDRVYWVEQTHTQEPPVVQVRDPRDLVTILYTLKVTPTEPMDNRFVCIFTPKLFILQYDSKKNLVLEAFDIKRGFRFRKIYLDPPLDLYIDPFFMSETHAILFTKPDKSIHGPLNGSVFSFATCSVVEPFAHKNLRTTSKTVRNRVTTYFPALSNSFCVRVAERESELGVHWIIWIADLNNWTEREYTTKVTVERLDCVKIVDERILILQVAPCDRPNNADEEAEGELFALDLAHNRNEPDFWNSKNFLGMGDLFCTTPEAFGDIGFLRPGANPKCHKKLMKLPYKPAYWK